MLSFHHSDFALDDLLRDRPSVSVCLPARNEARTIGPIVEALVPLVRAGAIDQVAVLDDSTDGTGEIASSLGAEVYSQHGLRPDAGPLLGKGDAMWRALEVARGDIVCFLDADSEDLGPHYVLGLVGPLLRLSDVHFVKAFYRRPFRMDGTTFPEGGGRVTELTARPLLSLLYPELAEVRQPLAGEIAVRRPLLERLTVATGYAVDVALLIDAFDTVGAAGLAQVDLDVRQNDHQPLSRLGPMATEVSRAILARAERDGRLGALGAVETLVERPPAARLTTVATAA